MSDTAVATVDPASKQLGFKFISIEELTTEQKDVLKSTVAQGTTDVQLTYFLNVAFSQELDPFKKEVWCILYNGKLTIQTGRDGLLKVAKRDPTFDRIQSCEVRDGDTFTMDPISGQVEHRLTTKRGQIVGAYAIITRKDGTKLSKYVTFAEYNDPSSPIWKDYPTAMVTKCVESVLCKQFANVTGIVAEETMHKDGVVIDSSPSAQAQQSSLKDTLIAQIESCQTPAEFSALRDTIAGAAGKLFGPEKEAVFAAAKAKKAELLGNFTPNEMRESAGLQPIATDPIESVYQEPPSRPDMTGKVVNHKDGDPTNNDPGNLELAIFAKLPTETPPESHSMPEDDFLTLLDSIRNQETPEGVDAVAAAADQPKSPEQEAELAALCKRLKTELTKVKKPKK